LGENEKITGKTQSGVQTVKSPQGGETAQTAAGGMCRQRTPEGVTEAIESHCRQWMLR